MKRTDQWRSKGIPNNTICLYHTGAIGKQIIWMYSNNYDTQTEQGGGREDGDDMWWWWHCDVTCVVIWEDYIHRELARSHIKYERSWKQKVSASSLGTVLDAADYKMYSCLWKDLEWTLNMRSSLAEGPRNSLPTIPDCTKARKELGWSNRKEKWRNVCRFLEAGRKWQLWIKRLQRLVCKHS